MSWQGRLYCGHIGDDFSLLRAHLVPSSPVKAEQGRKFPGERQLDSAMFDDSNMSYLNLGQIYIGVFGTLV